eukprot:m51a1_g13218 putative elongator complex protein 1 (450) ;mRNA; r:243-2206
MGNCSSFAVTEGFLLATSYDNVLRVFDRALPLQDAVRVAMLRDHRAVERGAQIVAGVEESTAVVLQMPRGNLEVVHPRPIVLKAMRALVARGDYAQAFAMAKRHRVDLNVVCDIDPEAFVASVESVVRQIDKPDLLNILLSSLRDTDVCAELYPSAQDVLSGATRKTDAPGKVNAVCDAFNAACSKIDPRKYVLTILTTHVLKSPPEIETALRLVRRLKEEETGEAEESAADDALEYIAFLVDADKLYDVALQLYDFDLVLMVAPKTQKDPKEYLPFISHLRSLPGPMQRYTIDLHLGNHASALRNLSAAGEEHFGECVDLVKRHGLYREALDVFRGSPEKSKTIAALYAQDLASSSRHEQAGMLFMQAGMYSEAAHEFLQGLYWQQAVSAARMSRGEVVLADFVKELADALVAGGLFQEAADVLANEVGDVRAATGALVEGKLWLSAA